MDIPKKQRARRNTYAESQVKGLRADKDFFKLLDITAQREGTSRNELIVRVMTYYCTERTERGDRSGR